MASPKVPDKFHPGSSYKFPKRKFGNKGEERTFKAEWCRQFPWIHYHQELDAVLCHICMEAEFCGKFLASTKREPAFIKRGFTYWKEGTTAFKKHSTSACHREAVSASTIHREVGDVGERLSTIHQMEKAVNKRVFMTILQNIRFLARQGLALRGHDDSANSNFIQLLKLREFDCHDDVAEWMKRKTNKYTSPDIQNECLQIMALNILRDISKEIATNRMFTIMADECTDSSNKEQFTICIRWVDDNMLDHEDFIGLYNVGTIDANCLVATIKDVLLRMNLKLADCRGQCYDGASNMTGSKNGVAAQLQREEPRAIMTHCYGHALNLAVGGSLKQSKACSDALDTGMEISKLIRFSPKRNAIFDKIKSESVEGETSDDLSRTGIRAFCPTRWTVRADAVESILTNYSTLYDLWDISLDTKLDPDIKGRIIGVQTQMTKFHLLFGLCLCKTILKITDNLSRTLQQQSMSAGDGQRVTKLTVLTLSSMRTEESFDLFFKRLEQLQSENEFIEEPTLPRKRKAPKRFEVGTGDGSFSGTVAEFYRPQYFEAIDMAITCIRDRFDQPGYVMYQNLEQLVEKSANKESHQDVIEKVKAFYKDDLSYSDLSAQLDILATHFQTNRDNRVTVNDCIEYVRNLKSPERVLFSEVWKVIKLMLVVPATNAVSERSFSAMRRLKSYLRSTMRQDRLNHVMLLNMNPERLDKMDLTVIANEFVRESEHRLGIFGRFD